MYVKRKAAVSVLM